MFVDEAQLAGLLAMAVSLSVLARRGTAYARRIAAGRIPPQWLPAVAFGAGVVTALALRWAALTPTAVTWPVTVIVGVLAGALAVEDYDQTRALSETARAQEAVARTTRPKRKT